MRELLSLLPKPSHYAGSEFGAVRKNPAEVRVRLALAFPDLYEVGMSYMGHSILYNLVNGHEAYWAERVYAPSVEAAEILRAHETPLATLESDTPLHDLDVVGFSLTHELCYTNVLFMLDLGGIPLRTSERGESDPLVLAGGGCTFNAEPMAPFFDAMILGDGEEVLIEVLAAVDQAKQDRVSRAETVERLSRITGVYVPGYYEPGEAGTVPITDQAPERVEKRLVADLDKAPFPRMQPQAFDAVHDRYTIEIARGCTRGCRFCQAGMIYRPVRERSLEKLDEILNDGLTGTGYGELSFLALSAGDFSTLAALFGQSFPRCLAEQVGISLPSLRVGSVSEEVIQLIAGIRRTGATLAPEAGSQRLRDVICKGVTEEGLLAHVKTLLDNGWNGVKLYFMIGLPTETFEDLDAIFDLCCKVEALGSKNRRLQITASVSPFVPKPHTPFQWERQISYEEVVERIGYLRDKFRTRKRIKLKWHTPEMSFLEGIFARGDRRLAGVVETAYRRGALFSSWVEHLDIDTWLDAVREHGFEPASFLAERDPEIPLPWAHLDSGVSQSFLLRERKHALDAALSPDCRFGACLNCGVCSLDGRASRLTEQAKTADIHPRVNQAERDQAPAPEAPSETETMDAAKTTGDAPATPPAAQAVSPVESTKADAANKAAHYRLWFEKLGPSIFLSQLELQSVLERALRRERVPIAFSQGFHPMPLISFSRALPVGVQSYAEYCNVFLHREMPPEEVLRLLAPQLPEGMRLLRVEPLSMKKKQPQPVAEDFMLDFTENAHRDELRALWDAFANTASVPWTRTTKRGVRTLDIRPLVKSITHTESGQIAFTLDWSETYVSPLGIIQAILPDLPLNGFTLTKLGQHFAEEVPE